MTRNPLLFVGLLLLAVAAPCVMAQAPIDVEHEVIVWWPSPDAAALRLLNEITADIVITPLASTRPRTAGRPIRLLAEIPAGTPLDSLPAASENARTGGYDGAAVTATGEATAFRQFVAAQNGFVQLVYVKPEQIGWDVTPAHAVLQSGIWPGLHHLDTATSSASERPWLDANLNLYIYLRAFYPQRPPLLTYRPDKPSMQYEAVEIALSEAFASGGNVILFIPDNYRQALLSSNTRAASSWRSLARTAGFVKGHRALIRHGGAARIGVLSASLEQAEEILNLSYRNNLAPQVLPTHRLPPLTPDRFSVVAAANLPVDQKLEDQLLAYAAAGGNVLAAPPAEQKSALWWTSSGATKTGSQTACDVYSLGKGKIYGYRESVTDPAEFALDMREVAGLDNPGHTGLHGLDFRVWNSSTILGAIHRNPGETVLILTGYGSDRDYELLVGVRGEFEKATFEDVRGGPKPIALMPREGRVELDLKGLSRVGILVLQEKAR